MKTRIHKKPNLDLRGGSLALWLALATTLLAGCENPLGGDSKFDDRFLNNENLSLPLAPASFSDGKISPSTSSTPSLSWTASASAGEAGFSGYEIAIGSSVGNSDILGWTNVGNVTTKTLSSGFTFSDGTVYYASVRAKKGSLSSASVAGDGFIANSTEPAFNCDFSLYTSTDCFSDPLYSTARPLVRLYRSGGANTSPGTYINSAGVMKTAVTNNFLRSEEFQNASWGKVNLIVTADATTAPDGTVTADKLIANNTAGVNHYVSQSTNMVAGEVWCGSYYLKAGEYERVWIVTGASAFSTYRRIEIRLTDGTITSTYGSPTLYGITSVGNGWHRAHLCADAGVTAGGTIFLQMVDNSNSHNSAGNNVDGIYAWGAQLELGTAPTPYIYTDSSSNYGPRLDHDPASCSADSCTRLGLLTEEGRSNVMLRSSDLTHAAWGAQSGLTLAASSMLSPDQTTTGALLSDVDTGLNSYLGQAVTIANNSNTWTCSFYLKEGTAPHTDVTVNLYGGTVVNSSSRITWATKSAVSLGAGSFTLKNAGNGWYRLSATIANNTSGNTTGACYVYPAGWATGGTTSGTVYAWGGQFEQSAYPTSYIPTTTAALSRGVDNMRVTSISWINTSKGTLLATGALRHPPTSGTFPAFAQIYTTPSTDDLALYLRQVNSTKACRINRGGVAEFVATAAYDYTSFTTLALAYQAADAACFSDGGSIGSTTSNGVPPVTTFSIGSSQTSGWIREVKYYDDRLSNLKLQYATQP